MAATAMPDCELDERVTRQYDEAGRWPERVMRAAEWLELPESAVVALATAADVALRHQLGHLPNCAPLNSLTVALADFLAEARDRYENAGASAA